MLDRMTFARKAHYIFTKTRATLEGMSQIGFLADFDCPVSAIDDTIFDMLTMIFPEVDTSFFELVFYESKEICSEDEFVRMLMEETEIKDTNENEKMKEQANPVTNRASCDCDCDCACKKDSKDKATVKTVKIHYVPSQDEIDKALRALFGFDF